MECKFRQVDRTGTAKVRINRYIMECKWKSFVDYAIVIPELIDTLWNVNFFVQHIFLVVFLN